MDTKSSESIFPIEGWVLFVKQDCETCVMIEPVVGKVIESGHPITIYTQDNPNFMSKFLPQDDTNLEHSFNYNIKITPTLIRFSKSTEQIRIEGWCREDWCKAFGLENLGIDLPYFRPGCGSKSLDPGVYERLFAKYGNPDFEARQIEVGEWDDDIEACYDRGWSDGLPVTPPTDARVIAMLMGTKRDPKEVIGEVPPNLAPITIEKIAINAVLAGCKPEYLPVVISALEAALDPIFTMHGLLCTTCFSSPIIIVNGPIAKSIGMNWGVNALGQGNRANATIGRALQLIIRNVGGGVPGDLDRSTLGGPGKFTFCFAEDETDDTWEPLSKARGFESGQNTVTLFQGDGIQGVIDQRSKTPDTMIKSLSMSLLAVGHPKLAEFTNALLILSHEHYAIFRKAGWGRSQITDELHKAMIRPGKDLIYGAQGVGEGISTDRAEEDVNKFWPEGLVIVRAGAKAGLFSAICAGWTGGRFRYESQTVTKEITI